MGSSCDAEASIFKRRIFERVPERQGTRRVCEVDATILMRDDPTADTGEFGDELAIRNARITVPQGCGDSAMESRFSKSA